VQTVETHEGKSHRRAKFRHCNKQDFQENHFTIPKDQLQEYEKRLCPESGFKDVLSLKNGY